VAGYTVRLVATHEVSGHQVWIQRATLRDLLPVARLQRLCFPDGQAYGLVTLLVLYCWPGVEILVARIGDRVAGCVLGDAQRIQARVLNLCVAPEFRRQGIASALLRAVERVLDAEQYTLMVEDKNFPAQALYRRSGYLPISELRHYYGRNRHGILMQKRRRDRSPW
jgi:ribosomal-protein-alanine N-acetyltransferase